MAPRRKESREPTRRSARTLSQSAFALSSAPRKRGNEEEEIPVTASPVLAAPEAKKAKTSLGIGDKLPDIKLQDEDGNAVRIVDIASEKGIILFAYTRASTPGCTKQVHFTAFSTPPSPRNFPRVIIILFRRVGSEMFSGKCLRGII
jgi:hypothetical protein